MGAAPSFGKREAESPSQMKRQLLAKSVREAFLQWRLTGVWATFERAFAWLETPPHTKVHVNRFQFFSIFGYSRHGSDDRQASFVSLPLYLFKVFAESATKNTTVSADEALMRANLYELFMVLCMFSRGDPREKAAMLFRMFDLDGGGDLDASELAEFMQIASRALYRMGQIPKRVSKRGTRKLSKAIMKKADTNGDGKVDWEEFFIWAQSAGTTKSLVKSMAAVAEEDGEGVDDEEGEVASASELDAAMSTADGSAAASTGSSAGGDGSGKPGRRARRWSVTIMGGVDVDLEALGGASAAAELAHAAAAVRHAAELQAEAGGPPVPSEAAISEYLEKLLAKADRSAARAGRTTARMASAAAAAATSASASTDAPAPSSPAASGAGCSSNRSRRNSHTDATSMPVPQSMSKQERRLMTSSFIVASRRIDSGPPSKVASMTHGVVHGPAGPDFHAESFIGSLFHEQTTSESTAPDRTAVRVADESLDFVPKTAAAVEPKGQDDDVPAVSAASSVSGDTDSEHDKEPITADISTSQADTSLSAGQDDEDDVIVDATDPEWLRSSQSSEATARAVSPVVTPQRGEPAAAAPPLGLSIRAPSEAVAPVRPSAGAESPLPLPIRGPMALLHHAAMTSATVSDSITYPATPVVSRPMAVMSGGLDSGGITPTSARSSNGQDSTTIPRRSSTNSFTRDLARLPAGTRVTSGLPGSARRLSPLARGMQPSGSAASLTALHGMPGPRMGSASSQPRARGRLSLSQGRQSPSNGMSIGAGGGMGLPLTELLAQSTSYGLPAIAHGAAGSGFSPTLGDLKALAGASKARSASVSGSPPPRHMGTRPGSIASPAIATPATSISPPISTGSESVKAARVSGVGHQPLLWAGSAAKPHRERTSSLSLAVSQARDEVRSSSPQH